MDIRFLSTLLNVVQAGSYAQAARRQNLTAATVAQRIHALENDLKLTLFTRAGHTVLPTNSCKALIPRMERIVAEAAQLHGDADCHGLSGTFRLGAISTVLADKAPSIVDRFAKRAPNAKLTLLPGTSAQLYQDLCDGVLDLAMISSPAFVLPKILTCRPVASQPLVLVVPQSEFSEDISALCTQNPLLIYDRLSWGGKMIWDSLSALIPQPTILCELDALETIATLVARGMGVSVLPQWAGLSEFAGIRLIPFPGPSRQIIALASIAPERPNLIELCLAD